MSSVSTWQHLCRVRQGGRWMPISSSPANFLLKPCACNEQDLNPGCGRTISSLSTMRTWTRLARSFPLPRARTRLETPRTAQATFLLAHTSTAAARPLQLPWRCCLPAASSASGKGGAPHRQTKALAAADVLLPYQPSLQAGTMAGSTLHLHASRWLACLPCPHHLPCLSEDSASAWCSTRHLPLSGTRGGGGQVHHQV